MCSSDLFVTIISPGDDGNLETSIMTVSERSPWQTVAPRQIPGGHYSTNAHADGYRIIDDPPSENPDTEGGFDGTGQVEDNSTATMQQTTQNSTVQVLTVVVTGLEEPAKPSTVTGGAGSGGLPARTVVMCFVAIFVSL